MQSSDTQAPLAGADSPAERDAVAVGPGSTTAERSDPASADAAWPSQEAVPPDPDGDEQGRPAIPSLAAIAGHPIHPMLVPIPIGALSLALVSDVAYAATHDRFWARASRLLLGTGIVSGALAGAVGSIDFTGRPRIRRHAESWLHAGGNVAALALAASNLALRRADERDGVVPAGLVLSMLTGGLLMATGWLGGELSYRHRIGVTAD